MLWLETAAKFYQQLAQDPAAEACCAGGELLRLPGLVIPEQMLACENGTTPAVSQQARRKISSES
jgi:hypothetical protein